jgi:predicted AlkP superfamily phosphohydrolase/phosphomutase
MSEPLGRTLVVGLDGATFDIIRPLVSEGRLPYLARALETGFSAVLKSTIPPVSAPAWTSFRTGKNPGKHGVYDFTGFKPNSYERQVVNSSYVRSKGMEHLTSEAGKNVVMINVPFTYPPYRVNGVMVSGLLSPPDGVYTYPPQLTKDLKESGYIVDCNWYRLATRDEAFEQVMAMTESRFKCAKELMKSTPWELFVVVFVGPDRLQHRMWDDKEKINTYYARADEIVGELSNMAGEETLKIIMSDHGFGLTDGTFYVNEWLANLGLLRKEYRVGDSSVVNWTKLQYKKKPGSKWLGNLRAVVDMLRSRLPRSMWEFLKKLVPERARHRISEASGRGLVVRWEDTQAYLRSERSQAINVNLQGREPEGIVPEGEAYEGVRTLVREKLLELQDTAMGQPVVDAVMKGEGLYSGDAEGRPDLAVVSSRYILSGGASGGLVIRNAQESNHHADGILIMHGGQVASEEPSAEVSIMDIAPTILHALGVDIPSDMDGRVLFEAFEDEAELKAREPRYQGPSQVTPVAYEGSDDLAVEERLRGLGYIE